MTAALLSQPLHAANFHLSHNGETVVFRGRITEASSDALIENLRAGARKLVITSAGGDPEHALKLGRFIQHRGIDVAVVGYCFASCANYVFLAGCNKELDAGAVLGFNGGQVDFDADEPLFRKAGASRDLLRKSLSLTRPDHPIVHTRITVDGRPIYDREADEWDKDVQRSLELAIGSGKPFSLEVDFRKGSKWIAYFPSEATLKKYGVTGIVRYPYPADAAELSRMGRTAAGAFRLVGDSRPGPGPNAAPDSARSAASLDRWVRRCGRPSRSRGCP